MARQTNAAYWAQRLKNMEGALLDQSFSYVENMEAQFAAAQAELEKQIAVWYQRFADNNGITFADAKRLLTKDELAEFHWTVGEYIAHGQQNALDGAWIKQLENASARVHISRLEALKLQIQQQAELLYANQLDFVDAAARRIYEGSYYGTAFEVQRGLGVGWTMQALDEGTITKVLSRPWTVDGQTFRDRCWTNKRNLVNSVNTQLTQMIIRGEAPDRAIAAISKQFGVSRSKAGRLIMTESAYFASAAQKDCYNELGVERYKIVASFDSSTCELCGAMDGQVFKMSDYQTGLTAPPFHPWCRCCTAPYFEDMVAIGERWARNEDGTTHKVPANTTFAEWKKQFVPAANGNTSLQGAGASATMKPWEQWAKITGAHTTEADIKGTNPLFSSGREYQINCQRCVPAYEMRRRGYDVTALPRIMSGVDDTANHWQGIFENAQWLACSSGSGVTQVTNQLKAWGDGARAEIYVAWKGRGAGAHVFVGENSGGTIRFLDPQSGALDVSHYFKHAKTGSTLICRIDGLDPTDYILGCCEVKKP